MLEAEEKFPDEAHIDYKKYTFFYKRMVVNQNLGKYEEIFKMDLGERIRCMSEAIDW